MLRHVGALCRAIRNKSPMHRKMGPVGYYKGVGARVLGKHVSAGGFQVDALKVPVYDVPDLTGFALRPYVSKNSPSIRVAPPPRPSAHASS